MGPATTHEEFMQAVQNHLKERDGCPVMVIIQSPMGMEMQVNFMNYALQLGLLEIAKMTTAIAFERQTQEGFKSGENQLMESAIKDAIDQNKNKPN